MWSNKVFRYSFISIISILVLGYLSMVLTSIDTYYPGTVINGQDFGFKSPLYVDNALYKNPSDYNLDIKFRENTETINGRAIGMSVNYIDELKEIKKSQNPFLWFTCFWDDEYTLEESVKYNDVEVNRILDGFEEFDESNMKEPKNPRIVLDDDDTVVAIEGDLGNTIEDVEAVRKKIHEAIVLESEELDVEALGAYKRPEYELDDQRVQNCVTYCNKIASLDIEYQYADEEIPIEPHYLFSTIKIAHNYNCSISKEQVRTVIESFSRLYDTFDKNRTFKTHGRDSITITNSHYGWKINVDEEVENLYSDIIHHNDVTREPAFEYTGYYYDLDDKDDVGDFYAEVDLANQHMYLYKRNNVILDSDVVTGCVALGRGTPGGIYSVAYKQSPAILVGEDYETPVTYWMPFNGGIGFHDATWRGSFGGSIYMYSGSHGCVNMPYYKAQELFGLIEAGMPVIVY